MNFIVDAQLPKSLADFLNWKGHDCIHTIELPDKNRTRDYQINKIAVDQNRVVITKDNDFLDSYILKSLPPKLILVTTGNIPNNSLIKLFSDNLTLIVEMLNRSNLIEIGKTEIVEQK
jgi:predicted nuclease of predicted toxin-antitoxin system